VTVPASIFTMNLLKVLGLSMNRIEELPSQIGDLKNLEELHLIGNQINLLPEQISNLVNLKLLALTSNKLEIIPKHLYPLSNLEVLWLSYNPIKKIPSKLFKNLQKLKKFSCGFSKITSIPKQIKYCTLLEKLVLKCNIIPYLPIELKSIPNLSILEFNDNPTLLKKDLVDIDKLHMNLTDSQDNIESFHPKFDEPKFSGSIPKLFELAARYICLNKIKKAEDLPEDIHDFMKKCKNKCTVCGGHYFNISFYLITMEEITKDHILHPLLHRACSINCTNSLKEKYGGEVYLLKN